MENYNVLLSEAKTMSLYKFSAQKSIADIKNALENLDSLYVLEFGNVDIEITMRDDLTIDYCVCAKYENTGWETHGLVDELFDINKFDSIEEIENDMFDKLMGYLKQNNLYWNKLN